MHTVIVENKRNASIKNFIKSFISINRNTVTYYNLERLILSKNENKNLYVA